MTKQFAILDERAAVEIGGPDRADFLQGLITNDVAESDAGTRRFMPRCSTAQGRYLHDLFLAIAAIPSCSTARPRGFPT